MARVLEPQQVEIIGRHWLIGELVRAGLEAAEPVRDIGIDLLKRLRLGPPSFVVPAARS